MIKTVAALMALIVGGFAGAALTADTDAQRIDRIEVEDEKIVILERQGDKRSNPPRFTFQRGSGQMPNGQREQWQIREVNDWIMLFNPSSGETFYLEDDDDGVYWKPIERRGGPDRHEGRGDEGGPPNWWRKDGKQPNRGEGKGRDGRDGNRWEREMEDAEERMERGDEAIDRLREALERAEEARNRGREKRDNRGGENRGGREKLEDHLEKLEEVIDELEEKFVNADGKELARKLERKLEKKYEELKEIRRKLRDSR